MESRAKGFSLKRTFADVERLACWSECGARARACRKDVASEMLVRNEDECFNEGR